MNLAAAWTGGQYSLLRAAASLLLAALVLDANGVWLVHAAVAGALVVLALGAGGRPLAAALALLAPFVLARPGDPSNALLAALWLVLHLLLPDAPYGSLAARGRASPAGEWSMPEWYPFFWLAFFFVTRVFAGIDAAFDGRLWSAGLYVVAALLVLSRDTSVPAWMLSLAVGAYDAAHTGSGLPPTLFFHALTFQPAWLPRREAKRYAVVFYDGSCALCHGTVRFLLSEDPEPSRFRIAPLGGALFEERVAEAKRAAIPDSVVVVRGDEILVRSEAVREILHVLGGFWRALGALSVLVPATLRDAAYDAVAARRYGWFGRKAEACPLLPAGLRGRVEG